MCVAVKICYQFKDLTSSILKHIVIGPEKFKKFHVPKSRQMKSKLFLLIFFTINELQKPPWNGFSLAWSKTFDEFAFYLIWYDVGGEAKICFQNPNFVIYCIIIPFLFLEAWKFWGACVCYFITPHQSNQTLSSNCKTSESFKSP